MNRSVRSDSSGTFRSAQVLASRSYPSKEALTPTPEHRALATQAGALADEILHRAQQAGAVRADIGSTDLPMIYEQLAAIRLGDAEHIRKLRRRYLDVHLAGRRAVAISYGELTGGAPTQAELGARWNRTT
jgi:hypothetical protein